MWRNRCVTYGANPARWLPPAKGIICWSKVGKRDDDDDDGGANGGADGGGGAGDEDAGGRDVDWEWVSLTMS